MTRQTRARPLGSCRSTVLGSRSVRHRKPKIVFTSGHFFSDGRRRPRRCGRNGVHGGAFVTGGAWRRWGSRRLSADPTPLSPDPTPLPADPTPLSSDPTPLSADRSSRPASPPLSGSGARPGARPVGSGPDDAGAGVEPPPDRPPLPQRRLLPKHILSRRDHARGAFAVG